MSRTQDLVLARLRLIALRWQGGMADVVGTVDGAEPPAAGSTDPGDPGGAGDLGGPLDPGEWAWGAGAESRDVELPAEPPTWPVLGLWVRLVGLLVVVVAIGGAAVLVSSWPREQPAAGPVSSAVPSGDPFADPFLAATPSPAPSVTVHVVGEVRDPGVVELPSGSRVVDAVRAAGGLRRGGDLGGTNLARVLADGERIEVGGQEASAGGGMGGSVGGSGGPLDLNTATAEQLDALPGIGPVTASKILAWRATHNRFSVVDELTEVPGIGPKTLEDLRPLVRV